MKKTKREKSEVIEQKSKIVHKYEQLAKKQKGVTLVALVVTIIVLLILAGVTISTVMSDNGIIAKAQQASSATKKSAVIDQINVDIVTEELNSNLGTGEGLTQAKLEEILAKYAKNGAAGIKKDSAGKITGIEVDGVKDIIKIEEIYKGDLVYGGITEGQIANVNKIYKDATGKTAVIPAGFSVVPGSDISSGLVISDVAGDDLNNSKGGNQFVWIPVDGTNLKYEKHKYSNMGTNDTGGSTQDGPNGWKTYCYTNYNGWTDNGGNVESVAKYKGFYIARYEAGAPSNADFFNNTDGSSYYQSDYQNNNSGTNSLTSGDYANTYKSKDVTNYIPVSKKNNPSWNFISQTNAKIVSENMYQNSKSVKSSLIDGYAWDTVSQWLQNEGIDVVDSTSWGNYYDAKFDINGLYAKHEWKNTFFPAYTYNYGSYSKAANTRVETATGSIERNKAKNIYDFAGNMWEWTTEQRTGTVALDSSNAIHTLAVLRGGGFTGTGAVAPAAYRVVLYETLYTYISIGFRVVLYIK